jgi:succinylglutamate desuccinylase
LQRIIGHYTGQERGTLIIALAAMHGNEPAGIQALNRLFQMLEDEPKRNSGFIFRGRIVGVMGNIQAFERKLRFVKKDLNRELTLENLKNLRLTPQYRLAYEDLELIELTQAIKNEIIEYKPSRLVVVDLHTTSASGGIFSIVSDDVESLNLATQLNAPVVLGMIGNTGGTTLHYFKTENMGIPTVSICFEGGQHNDALSIQRMIAWLVNLLREVKSVDKDDVENRHEVILKNYSKHLPKVVDLFYVHHIQPSDHFQMREGYKNFQAIKAGEVLADDKNGEIVAPEDCLLLMPLYQRQGTDGFFLVK